MATSFGSGTILPTPGSSAYTAAQQGSGYVSAGSQNSGNLALGNYIATPNANVTPAQTAAAQAAGWTPTNASFPTGGTIYQGGQTLPPVNTTVNAQTVQNASTTTGGVGTPLNVTPATPAGSNLGTTAQNNINAGMNADGTPKPVLDTTKFNPDGTPKTNEQQIQDLTNQEINARRAPASNADSYNQAVNQSGQNQAQSLVNSLQNQVNAVNTRMQTDLQSLRGVGAANGVTEAVYGQQSAEVTREGNLQLLPLQAQLAAAQNNLDVAKQMTTQLFSIYSKDAQNSVDFYNQQSDALYNSKIATLTKAEQLQIDNNKTKLQNDYLVYDNNLKSAQTAANDALTRGDSATYNAITSALTKLNGNMTDPTANDTNANVYSTIASTVRDSILTPSGGTGLPAVQMLPNGTPDPVVQSQFLSTLPTDVAVLVKGMADYTINPTTVSTRTYKGSGTLTRADVLALVQQYDPTYNQAQYASRQSTLTNFQSGTYSKNINALNTAVGHISEIPQNFGAMGNTPIPALNWVKNNIAGATGNGSIIGASTNIHAATGELASVFKTGGATDQEIKNLGTLGTNASPGQEQAFVQTSVNLLASRLQALTDTYTSAMGKPPATDFLSPTSKTNLSNLKNEGYNIQIPGVLYTDKTAWQTHGGGTQDQWNGAVDVLNQKGIPLTDENILQAAQVLNQ